MYRQLITFDCRGVSVNPQRRFKGIWNICIYWEYCAFWGYYYIFWEISIDREKGELICMYNLVYY